MVISPYLSAIQSLKGENPSEKYKEIHSTVEQLIVSSKEKGIEAAVSSSKIPTALYPLIRIYLGNKLKSREEIIEALKSEDVTVRNQALKAKWFFDGSDNTLNADFFVKNVMPFVSAKTQRKIIKTLSINLLGKIELGESFYHAFLKLYDYEKVSPLLLICNENTIFDKIIKDKIDLTKREIYKLFKIHPQMIVRYLLEGLTEKKDKKLALWTYDDKYKKFLPNLIKNYPNDFFELCNVFYHNIRIGSELQKHLLNNHLAMLIEQPLNFLKIFTIKDITKNLTDEQFENFYINLYQRKICDINLIMEELKYYPKEKWLPLLKKAYKIKNNSELLDDIEYIKSYEFLALLSLKERQNIGRKIVEATPRTSENYFRWCSYFPPDEAFNIFKKEIIHSSDANNRLKCFKRMVRCCIVNDDKEYLLNFLNFYNERHKNERASVLQEVLGYIAKEVPADFLNKSHWEIIRKIMLRSYIKKDFLDCHSFELEEIFKSALHYLLVQRKDELMESDTKKFLDEIVEYTLEYCVHHLYRPLIYVSDPPDVTKKSLQVLLNAMPLKYPDQHEIWQNGATKINYALEIIKTINHLNKDFLSKKKINELEKLTIMDYPWLVEIAKSVLLSKDDEKFDDYKKLKDLLKEMEPTFYNLFATIDMETEECPTTISISEEIESGAILKLLRKNPEKISDNCIEYLEACQEKIDYWRVPSLIIRKFIRTSKWHQNLPLKFVTHCLQDLKNPKNIIMLGLLLEGEILSKTISQVIPEIPGIKADDIDDSQFCEIMASLPVAIDITNPAVNLEILEKFCRGDLVRYAARSVVKVSQRVPLPKAKLFAKKLITKPVSVQRYGFFMFLRFANNDERLEFLAYALKNLTHPSIHNIVVKKILHFFGTSPSQATWKLMKTCISSLTADDLFLLEDVCKNYRYTGIENEFAGLFYIELFYKIEKLAETGDLDEGTKNNRINLIFRSMQNVKRLKGLPDEACEDILNRYLLKTDFINRIYEDTGVLNFALNAYLWETPEKFEHRWNVVTKFLSLAVKNWNEKDSKNLKKYPARYAIHKFFQEFLYLFETHTLNLKLYPKAIELILNVFSLILSPWQEMSSYLKLYFYNLYSDNMTWKNYGIKCGECFPILVKEFSGELILEKVTESLYYIVKSTSLGWNKQCENLFDIMEGLCEVNNHYAAIVCIKILKDIYITHISADTSLNDRFLGIIDCLSKNDNISVKYILNDYMNEYFRVQ